MEELLEHVGSSALLPKGQVALGHPAPCLPLAAV